MIKSEKGKGKQGKMMGMLIDVCTIWEQYLIQFDLKLR
jgi:hypothetical protein